MPGKNVTSVSVVPISSGMSADCAGAVGSNGSPGSERPSTTGDMASGGRLPLKVSLVSRIFSIGSVCSLSMSFAVSDSRDRNSSVVFVAASWAEPANGRATLNDGALEQPFRGRHRHQRADFTAAARLAEQRHVLRIAAERRDVVANPFERGNDVQLPHVTRRRVLLAADARQIQVAEHAEPMVDRDDDHVVLAPQARHRHSR